MVSVKQMTSLHVGYIINDNHIIVSSDSDYYQLLSPNVKQYNGITQELITLEGVYNDKGKPVIDKKTKEPKQIGDPEWLLFEKCIPGDTSDNVSQCISWCPQERHKEQGGYARCI